MYKMFDICPFLLNTGRFKMFFAITNVYNKKTKGPTLMELFTATGKLNFFFDTAHIDTIFKLLPHTNISSCKKNQFSCACEKFHQGRSFCFLVINVCNNGERYETPCIVSKLAAGYFKNVFFFVLTHDAS